MRNWLGFEKWFDFSHEHSFSGKLKNFLSVFAFNLVWTVVMSAVMLFIVGFSKAQLANVLTTLIGQKVLYADLLSWSANKIFVSPLMLFFLACIMAPLWEEVVFRVVPIRWAEKVDRAGGKPGFLFWLCCFSSIIFGLGHGSIINILFQGVGGLTFSWLYLKNNDSYCSVFAGHSLWNFMVIFGLPLLMS